MIRKPIHENDPPSMAVVDMLRADHQQAAATFLLTAVQFGSIAELAIDAAGHLWALAASPGSQTADTLTVSSDELYTLLEPETLELIAALYEQAGEECDDALPTLLLQRASESVRALATALREAA